MKIEIEIFDCLDSTNSYALNHIGRDDLGEGKVVWALEQTAGKGQGKNQWESAKGKSLTFSVVLQPFFIEPENQFFITQMVSVALSKTVAHFIGKPEIVKIKWPNDIYVGDKKMAGMLIQNTLMGTKMEYSIVGIGLNVNQEIFYSDAPNPISIIHFTKLETSLELVLKNFLANLNTIYSNFEKGNFEEKINQEYLSSLYKYNEWAEFSLEEKNVMGKISGIGEYGRLEVTFERGDSKTFDFGEIQFITDSTK